MNTCRKWVDDRFAIQSTPGGEWAVMDYGTPDGIAALVSPGAVFPTPEAAWEFANR